MKILCTCFCQSCLSLYFFLPSTQPQCSSHPAAAAAKSLQSCPVTPMRPHGLQPTRLLHPRDFPGKSTGVACHSLFHICIESEAKFNPQHHSNLIFFPDIFHLSEWHQCSPCYSCRRLGIILITSLALLLTQGPELTEFRGTILKQEPLDPTGLQRDR